MAAAKVHEDRRKQIETDCVAEAWRTGATSAVTALGIAGAAVGGANYFFQGFRSSLGVSGKAALVVSPQKRFSLHSVHPSSTEVCSPTIGTSLDCLSCRFLQHLQFFGSIQSSLCMTAPRSGNMSCLSSRGKASHHKHHDRVAYAICTVLSNNNASTSVTHICATQEMAALAAGCLDLLSSVALRCGRP